MDITLLRNAKYMQKMKTQKLGDVTGFDTGLNRKLS